ncbi:MAG: hypothetical protein V4534_05745 [Myxococcota bacterium]
MLQNLPRLSKGDVQLCNLISAASGMAAQLLGLIAPVEKSLAETSSLPAHLDYKRLSFEKSPEITGSLFAATWAPAAGLFWIELDTKVLQTLVYKTITQAAPESLDPKLSDLEKGVALYLLAKLFDSTKESFQLSDQNEVPPAGSLCLSLTLGLGDQNSFVRIWVSETLLKSLADINPPAASVIAERAASRTAWAELPLVIEIASVEMTSGDLQGLEAGDIIMLDAASLKLTDKVISGQATAKIGSPASASLQGQLGLSESNQYTFSVSQIENAKELS